MATVHKVRFSVSATPIVIMEAVDGAGFETITVHENIRKTLGGSGEFTYAGAVDYGGTYTNGVSSTPYLNATSGGVGVGDGDTRFIWIKNTGFAYSSATELGDASTDDVNIFIDAEHFASLCPGSAWIIFMLK